MTDASPDGPSGAAPHDGSRDDGAPDGGYDAVQDHRRAGDDARDDARDEAGGHADAPDDLTPSGRVRRRAQRRARRRRRARQVGVVGTAVVVTVLVGLLVTDTLRWSGPRPGFAEGSSVVRAPGSGTADAALDQAGDLDLPRRPLSNDDPLRLWIGGDSLAGSFGVRLAERAGLSGVVAARLDYRVSSGIHDDGLRNWPAHAAEQLAAHDPEAVVFMIGTNDTVIAGGSGWESGYRERVSTMMDVLVGDEPDRLVFWVTVPTLGDPRLHSGAQEINEIMRAEASLRPQVLLVDAFALFGDRDGAYSASVAVPGAGLTQVRIADGVHLTDAGARYLADNVWAVVDAVYEIARYEDPSAPISWVESAGSGGGSSTGGSSSGSSSGGGSRSTSPPPATAAPPVTEPPVAEPPATTPETTPETTPQTAPPSTDAPPATPPSPTTGPGDDGSAAAAE